MALRRMSRAALVAGALSLSLSAAHAARPVVPAGQPTPPPTPDPKPDPKPDPTPTPTEPKSSGPVRPVGSKPAEPPKPEGPKTLPVGKTIEAVKVENPAEITYRQKIESSFFTLHVRPGLPRPGDRVELVLEVAEIHDPPDPELGDRVPVNNADLIAEFEKGGKAGLVRGLHPMGAGEYGLHVSPEEPGVYTLAVHRRTGKPGMDVSFQVGVGVPTPGRPDDMAATLKAQSGRGPVKGSAPAGGAKAREAAASAALGGLMNDMGEHLFAADGLLGETKGDAAAHLKALQDLAAKVPGSVPERHSNRRLEYEAQAQALIAGLDEVAKTADRAQARTKLQAVEQTQCMKCHAQFWWDVADDVAAWPAVKPATPEVK